MSIQIARQQVSNWLLAGVVMVMVQILLGGITRLTGSGLSITEWKPLMGTFPPLNSADWNHSFAQYRQIAQFKRLNNQFTLSDYQALYFWEWLHREWARLMGLVFIVPFLWFLYKRKFGRRTGWQLAGLFLLGTIQGLAGWLMVKSGLNDTDVSVSHIRLAVHFMLALLLLAYLFRIYLSVKTKLQPGPVSRRFLLLTMLIVVILGLQLVFGAFMAGTHAALYAPTWPDINGKFLSFNPAISGGIIQRMGYDPLLIQFVHRSLAYLLCVLILTWSFLVRKFPANSQLFRLRRYPLVLLVLQAVLGISCLLHSATPVYIWLALLHQLNGMLLWLGMSGIFFLTFSRRGQAIR
jgi:cytochrome c oxidase assembly protein subunit 15